MWLCVLCLFTSARKSEAEIIDHLNARWQGSAWQANRLELSGLTCQGCLPTCWSATEVIGEKILGVRHSAFAIKQHEGALLHADTVPDGIAWLGTQQRGPRL